MCNLIALTTLLHLYPVFFTNKQLMYKIIILISTILSFSWHMNNELINWIYYLDYFFALLIPLNEIVFIKCSIIKILLLNIFLFVTNKYIDIISLDSKNLYYYLHSIWHIISALKNIYLLKN